MSRPQRRRCLALQRSWATRWAGTTSSAPPPSLLPSSTCRWVVTELLVKSFELQPKNWSRRQDMVWWCMNARRAGTTTSSTPLPSLLQSSAYRWAAVGCTNVCKNISCSKMRRRGWGFKQCTPAILLLLSLSTCV
eukprot:1134489-Pelagomonas_calceolata.AAC.3